ncbi:MAG: hypothetical protein ACJ75M_22225, partial [Actinomycetes bacterium]
MLDLGDDHFRVVGLAHERVDAVHLEQPPGACRRREVGPDGLTAAQLGGLTGHGERVLQHPVL